MPVGRFLNPPVFTGHKGMPVGRFLDLPIF